MTPVPDTDSEKVIQTFVASLEKDLQAQGVQGIAIKVWVVDVLLKIGPPDEDLLYFDGECDNSSPHRRYAERIARQAVSQLPDASDAVEALGMSFIRLTDYERAIQCYEKMLAKGWFPGYAWNNVAWCQMRLGRLDEALASCHRALAIHPEHSYLHHDHASILFRLGRFDDALKVADHAIRSLKPEAPQLSYLRACVLEAKGNRDGAVVAWKGYLERVKNHAGHQSAVRRALERLKTLGHELPAGRAENLVRGTGMAPTSLQQIWEAVGFEAPVRFCQALADDESASSRAERLSEEGWKLLQRHDAATAATKCREALDAWPLCALARVLHARLALQNHAPETYRKYVALANLEQLVPPTSQTRQRALSHFVFLMILVNAEKLYQDGDYHAALRQLDEVYGSFPEDHMILFLRVLVLAALGRMDEARAIAGKLRMRIVEKPTLDTLMRACAGETPRPSYTASSPISSSGPCLGTGGYGMSRFVNHYSSRGGTGCLLMIVVFSSVLFGLGAILFAA